MIEDLQLSDLQTYRPPRQEPKDFDRFWQNAMAEAREHPLSATFQRVDYGLSSVETFDVTFAGYAGQPIKGWLLLPRARSGPLPCVVQYVGYGGGRSFPTDWLLWSSVGYAHFIMDTRGQGSAGLAGHTPDLQPEGNGPHYPGFMTLGVTDPCNYYYRRLITDAVRAVEAARSHPAVDPRLVAVAGTCQGGGLALAVSGLDPSVSAAMINVPMLCAYQRAIELRAAGPYEEITSYLKIHRDHVGLVLDNLMYFDGVNFAARAAAPSLFSTALMDDICPPSTVFAAYNHYSGGPKEMRVWPHNQHDGGGSFQDIEQIAFLSRLWD